MISVNVPGANPRRPTSIQAPAKHRRTPIRRDGEDRIRAPRGMVYGVMASIVIWVVLAWLVLRILGAW